MAEVSRIDRAIAALEDAAGPGPAASDAKPAGEDAKPAAAAPVVYPQDAYGRKPGPYSMLLLCEAAAMYLAAEGAPRSSREIADALRAGGYRTTSTHFTNTVQKMLVKSGSEAGIRRTANRKKWFVKR